MSAQTKAAHTPGPWTWRDDEYNGLDGVGGEVLTYASYENCWVAFGPHRHANAHLIAAAPTMKEALERIRECSGDPVIESICEAAIAKAEGREP